jgi:RNA-directed DNA polymerase
MKENRKKLTLNMGLMDIEARSKHLREHTRRNENTDHVNYKILHLLHDPFTYINAYAKISKNKGALTEGIQDEKIIQLFGLEKATTIAKKIKQDKYEFKPVKRTWVPKPGKKKKRPIDVPTQSDRIVQEAIRGILEAIYEPVFAEFGEKTKNLSNNYGFRPNKSCWSAIEKLKLHSKRCNVVLESGIVSAYNNVNHDILLKILSRRIRDKKFLKLIKDMLKSGIMDQGRFEHSLNGTPQRGIVSPLLFNIYMFEFDNYVYEQCIVPILKENKEQNKKPEVRSREYNQISYITDKAQKKYTEARDHYRTNGGDVNCKKMKEARKAHRRHLRKRLLTPYNDIRKLEKGAVYTRYADDWVLALTCSKKEAQETKEKLKKYLKEHLKMELDDDKTSTTFMSEGYKFLGFEIRRKSTKPKITKVLSKTETGKYVRTYQRTTSRMLTIEPDSGRILKRLRLLGMCNQKNFPIGKPQWTSYNEFQIVQKYAQIMRGIFNYYKPCERLYKLYQISYILQYSCAKTIAIRKKKTLPQVFKQYGSNLTIYETINNTKNSIKSKQQFYDLSTLKQMEKSKPLEQSGWKNGSLSHP